MFKKKIICFFKKKIICYKITDFCDQLLNTTFFCWLKLFLFTDMCIKFYIFLNLSALTLNIN